MKKELFTPILLIMMAIMSFYQTRKNQILTKKYEELKSHSYSNVIDTNPPVIVNIETP